MRVGSARRRPRRLPPTVAGASPPRAASRPRGQARTPGYSSAPDTHRRQRLPGLPPLRRRRSRSSDTQIRVGVDAEPFGVVARASLAVVQTRRPAGGREGSDRRRACTADRTRNAKGSSCACPGRSVGTPARTAARPALVFTCPARGARCPDGGRENRGIGAYVIQVWMQMRTYSSRRD